MVALAAFLAALLGACAGAALGVYLAERWLRNRQQAAKSAAEDGPPLAAPGETAPAEARFQEWLIPTVVQKWFLGEARPRKVDWT